MLNEEGASVGGASGRRKLPSISSQAKSANEDKHNEDKHSSNHEKSPGPIRSVNSLDWPGISEVSISRQNAVSYAAALFPSEASEKQPASVFATSDVSGESTISQISRIFPVTALTWLPFGAEQLSSIGDAENPINPDCGPSSYSIPPLMPISEIFEPIDSSASCDIQLVELQSPPLYGDYQFQMISNQSTQSLGIAEQSLLAKDSSVNWFSSPCSSSQGTITNILFANGMRSDGLPTGRPHQLQPQQPGCSLLRQMLAQTHHENARMHGVSAGNGVDDSWHWMQRDLDSNKVARSERPVIEIPASIRVESSTCLVPVEEKSANLLDKTAIIVEPLEENYSSDDPSYASKWEDEVKYGDAWNVNLNVVLGVHEEVPNNNNNTMCETKSN